MIIPTRFEEILKQNQSLYAEVLNIVSTFNSILNDNKLFFFEEYTDHGIKHIERVLKAAEFIIPEESFQILNPQEVGVLILSTLLHDIGMHVEFSTFNSMLNGEYDDVIVKCIDEKTWNELWNDYLSEVKHFSSIQKENIWGNPYQDFHEPDLTNKDALTGVDKKLIGEFLRRHHARFAHEIALKGLKGNYLISFGSVNIPELYKQLAGITARSHGMSIRNTFVYLKEVAYDGWRNPEDINVVFLMVLLRIADYLQIDKSRTQPTLLKLKTFNSPISLLEHKAHLSISSINFDNTDPELILVTCEPKDARMYVKLETLVEDIQHELDISWAVLGEVYGFKSNQPKIKFRRINSNLSHKDFLKKLTYIPQQISFKVNSELSKLLVAPLYGDDPKYGVRELVQNATDACKERIKIELDRGNKYEPNMVVSIDKIDDSNCIFKIKDNGKGMTLEEIVYYFLNVGSSFRKSYNWKKEFTDDGNSLINRNGRFGIGVLAAFLIGDEMAIKTKSYKENFSYCFNAKIDSDYIEIVKNDNNLIDDIGTEITIKAPISIYNSLKKLYKSEYGSKKRVFNWADWFIGDCVKFEYYLDKELITPLNIISYDRKKSKFINTEGYGKIEWGYANGKSWRNTYWGNNPDMQIITNDIVITLSSKYNKFIYSEKGSYGIYIINSKPNLIIDDPNGILPLKLDRNDIDTNNLSFDNDLLMDVSKQFIAQLLTLNITRDTIKKQDLFPHYTSFLFSNKGYALLSDFFIQKLMKSNYSIIKILVKDAKNINNVSFIYNISDNYYIYPQFDSKVQLTTRTEDVAPDTGGVIILSKWLYKNLFDLNARRKVRMWAKKEHEIIKEVEDYVIYNVREFQDCKLLNNESITATIVDEGLKKNKDWQSLQEIALSNLDILRGGEILDNLFLRYFGSNFIIPYNIEDRKKMYPLAFEELENYLKDYINIEKLDELIQSQDRDN